MKEYLDPIKGKEEEDGKTRNEILILHSHYIVRAIKIDAWAKNVKYRSKINS
jgi:hypothetical protein